MGTKLADLLGEKGPSKEKDSKKKNNDLLTGKADEFSQAAEAYMILKKHGYSTKTIRLTEKFNKTVKKDLGLNSLEYLLFVTALGEGHTSMANVSKISGEKSPSAMVSVFQVLISMYERNIFLIIPGNAEIYFRFSHATLNYLYSREEFKPETEKNLKTIIREIDSIANLYNTFGKTAELGEKCILNIISKYADTQEYCKILKEIYMDSLDKGNKDYKFIFYILGHLILNWQEYPKIDKDDNLIESFALASPENEGTINNVFAPKSNKEYIGFTKKIFDHAIDESGKADKNAIELHSNFKRKYLKDLIKEKSHEDVISWEKISKINLFFNKNNDTQIKELADMLSPRSFNSIKKRLNKVGQNPGFIILFSGYPGTGKTSLALELARVTKRNIIKVDMSSLRSKWWGEDEKNVKNIFNNYKSALQDSKLEPILLLNEADAIIGKRLDVGGHNGAIVSSINATQNIILDAFDEFEGILIATTNLTKNFDPAFERRFLYKIDFEKPDLSTKTQILVDKLNIPENDAEIISKDFELSGGNISNIQKKILTRQVLYGEEYSLEKMIALCKDEKITKDAAKIGFNS